MTDTLQHHELIAEWVNDNQGKAIMLTQPADNYDEPGTVLIHPWQLRAVCEQFGIIASDPQAAKTIATLTRRLHLLRDRIDRLHNYLVNHSDHKHADLTYEVTYATATADIADEFCTELTNTPAELTASPGNPAPMPPSTDPAPANAKSSASAQPSLI
jgi:hypothetical protein